MNNHEFQSLCAIEVLRRLRSSVDGAFDLVIHLYGEATRQNNDRVSIGSLVAAIETKADAMEKEIANLRAELKGIEERAQRVEAERIEAKRERDQERARELKRGELETAKQQGYGEAE